MDRKKLIKITVFLLINVVSSFQAIAQFTISGQLRTRTELRDGQGAPLVKGSNSAFFTSQRTRLNILYNIYRLKFAFSLQDVRVWGQDVSTINRITLPNNNGLLLYEAWTEILLSDTVVKNKAINLKIGRQELVYDDQRLLGNLDWVQQSRRHDAAILKFENEKWLFHLAGAYNQNQENSSGSLYSNVLNGNYAATTNGGSMYKSMQFIYIGRKMKQGNASFLLFADQFNKYHLDTFNNSAVKTFQTGAWSRVTTGLYFNNIYEPISITSSAYYQFGKNATGQKLDAGLLSGFIKYIFNKKFSAGLGIDYSSGGNNGNTSNNFDPLYGTPHKFHGFMDYYYASNPFGKGGLVDYYLKTKYASSDKFSLTADLHSFSSAALISDPNNSFFKKKGLGSEIDIVSSYTLTKQVGIEAGYSHYISSTLLSSPNVKNIANARPDANWAYIMVNVKPSFIFK